MGAIKKLDGEYAIILYDHVNQLIYLITDTFGTKPLYYTINKKKVYYHIIFRHS